MSNENLLRGAMECLALHKSGLFAGGRDGSLRHLEVNAGDNVRIVDTYTVAGAAISHISFNATHHKMAIGSSKVMKQGSHSQGKG